MAGCDHCPTDETALRDTAFRRVLWIALVLNAAMFIVEIGAGFLARSVSLQADGIDFFGDSANYAISLIVLSQGVRARAGAALIKAASMALFGLWVLGAATYFLLTSNVPEAVVMGPIAILALIVNVAVAMMLYAHRNGDSNRQSVWLCSRNDAISNVAVFLAAGAVYITGTGYPDILVAAIMAYLSLTAAYRVTRQALGEWREAHHHATPAD